MNGKAILTGGTMWATLVLLQKTMGITVPPSMDDVIVALTLIAATFMAWRKQWIINSQHELADVILHTLTARYVGRTYAHARAMIQPYIGRRIKVTGTLRNFYGHILGVSQAAITVDNVIVILRMPVWKARWLAPLPIDTVITVSGRIADVDSSSVRLDSVEILDVDDENA
jgi:hypothetical protein